MKRILRLVLAFLIIAAMTVTTTASTPQKIKSVHPEFARQLWYVELDGVPLALGQLGDLRVNPGSELRVYLAGTDGASLFFDQQGEPIATADITSARLLAAQVGVQCLEESGPEGLVDAMEVGAGPLRGSAAATTPYLCVRFADDLISLEEVPFSHTISLSLANQELGETKIRVGGVMRAALKSASPGESVVNIADGSVFVAAVDTRMQFLLGDGVSVMTPVRPGEKYYGRARAAEADLFRSSESGDPVMIYTLQTQNLNRFDCVVQINTDVPQYVYADDGEYLGTTRDALPYQERYIVCSRPGFPGEL